MTPEQEQQLSDQLQDMIIATGTVPNPARDAALQALSEEWERACPGLSARVAAETARADARKNAVYTAWCSGSGPAPDWMYPPSDKTWRIVR